LHVLGEIFPGMKIALERGGVLSKCLLKSVNSQGCN
jgi:hypothetical protein